MQQEPAQEAQTGFGVVGRFQLSASWSIFDNGVALIRFSANGAVTTLDRPLNLSANLLQDRGQDQFVGLKIAALGLKLDQQTTVCDGQQHDPGNDQQIEIKEAEINRFLASELVHQADFFGFHVVVF